VPGCAMPRRAASAGQQRAACCGLPVRPPVRRTAPAAALGRGPGSGSAPSSCWRSC
jgi:hypothetical protein